MLTGPALADEKDAKLMSSEGLEATEEEIQEVFQDMDDGGQGRVEEMAVA